MSHVIRASPRFAVEAEIDVRAGDVAAHGRTTNVSRGGLSAVVDRDVARGALVRVSIRLVFDAESVSEPLDLPARVVWATALGPKRHQLGVSFTQLGADEQSYLEMFLRYLEQDDSSPSSGSGDTDDSDDPFAS